MYYKDNLQATKLLNEVFSGNIQNLAQYIENFSASTEKLRKLLKKDTTHERTAMHRKAFEEMKENFHHTTAKFRQNA